MKNELMKKIIGEGLKAHMKSRIDGGLLDREIDSFIEKAMTKAPLDTLSFSFPIEVDGAFIEMIKEIVSAVRKFEHLT